MSINAGYIGMSYNLLQDLAHQRSGHAGINHTPSIACWPEKPILKFDLQKQLWEGCYVEGMALFDHYSTSLYTDSCRVPHRYP
jgi:hypothetical protein